jgi:hypothetical protein
MKMNILTMYNSALQVAAAFFIFVVGYLTLLFAIVLCLLIAEGLHQAFIHARISILRSCLSDEEGLPLTPAPAVIRDSALFEWTHRLTVSLTGLKDKYFHLMS